MNFIKIKPHTDLEQFIECYWVMENDDPEPKTEKIIPDGYTELIFHYGDDYRAQISGEWQTQSLNLLAGQISSFFYLQNEGHCGMVAVKLKPAALTQFFDLDMSTYTDKVVDLDSALTPQLLQLRTKVLPFKNEQSVKEVFDNYFITLSNTVRHNPVTNAIDLIFSTNGMVSVKEMTEVAQVGERQLERLFKKYVGLSPKYYARIIRFNYIFKLIQEKKASWSEIVYQSGYYDQSHFIKNFKAFTGEDPSSYFFEEENMANFFLKK